jgi:hypothetical protein
MTTTSPAISFAAPTALLLCLPALAQSPREAAQPPAATSITSTTPDLPAVREAAPPVLQAPTLLDAAQQLAQQSARRSHRRPGASAAPQLTNVMWSPSADGSLWAIGHDWKARFDGTGFEFVPFFGSDAPRNFPVRIELDRVTAGGEPIALAPGAPQQVGMSVRTARGGLTEVVDANLDHVEQSFVFEQLPNRGAIAVEIGVASELVGEQTAAGVRFTNEHGSVTYEKAIAVDATGAQLELPIHWLDGEIRMEIPASFVATAKLPLVLDPLLNSVVAIGSGAPAGQLQRDADHASIAAPDCICIVWKRQWSVTDQDAWAQLYDSNMAPLGTLLNLDFSILDWLKVSVASSRNGQNFLVAAEIRDGTLHYIAGRTISATGNVGATFDIERDGVIGLAGNNFRPDAGGDFYGGTAAYFAVVFEKEITPGNNDIYVKLVDQAGALVNNNPTVVENSTSNERFPSIGKNNGSFGGVGASQWLVTYQRTWPSFPFDEEVLGKFVLWNGTVQTPSMYIAGTTANEARPASSTPADVDGVRYWMCVYETGPSGSRDLVVKVYDQAGALFGTLNLDATEAAGSLQSRDRNTASVDSDGVRFVVTYMEPWNGTADWETLATTIAFSPALATMRLEEERVGLGLSVSNELGPVVSSRFAGSGQVSPEYFATHANDGPNTIELYRYGGYVPGNQFTFFGSACGSLAITPSGNTALGNTVTIDVANGPLSGTIFGFPGLISLLPLGCNCVLGVNNGLFLGNPLVWTVPNNPVFVGTVLSVQGWTILGSNCLTSFDLSDTVDFTIR